MFELVRSVFDNSKSVFESHYISAFDEGNSIRFVKENPSKYTNLYLGGKELHFSDEVSIDKSEINSNNVAICNGSNCLFTLGKDYSSTPFSLKLTEDQIQSLQSIQINKTNILTDDSEFTYSIYNLQDSWEIEIEPFLSSVPYEIKLNFEEYPSFCIQEVFAEDFETVDLQLAQRKRFKIVSPDITGYFYINSSKYDISEINGTYIPYQELKARYMYTSIDEIEGRISEWNASGIEVAILPENHQPIFKSISQVSENTTIFVDSEELTPLSTITLQYPSWANISPRISYQEWDADFVPDGLLRRMYESYDTISKDDNSTTVTFSSVVPEGQLRVFHSSELLQFEESSLKVTVTDSSTEYREEVELNPKKNSVKLINDTTDSVVIEVNNEMYQIIPKETLELKDVRNITTVKNSAGQDLTGNSTITVEPTTSEFHISQFS